MSSNFERFEELQKDGKRLAAEGRLLESLHKFELAKKIKETSKVLNRIQKLKDAIGQHEKKEESARKSEQSLDQKSSGAEKLPKVLNQIQNIEVPHKENIPAKLTPEKLKTFNELKNKAMDLSYEGKFDEALHCFYEAQKLWDCPKVKKYIQELQVLMSKYPKKLEEFRNLTHVGEKLASAGKQAESLEKLKNAYAVCPSPAISRMIKKVEVKNPSPEVPVFSGTEFGESLLTKKSDKDAEFSTASAVSTSSNSKENHFTFCNAKSSSSGSDFSLASGSTSSNPAHLSPKSKEHFKNLYSRAKRHAAEGCLQESLGALEEASRICPTQKVLKRIEDLKEHIREMSLTSSSDMIEVSNGFFIFHEIYEKLYPYQRESVAWMWKLFKMKKGGVLGDDMGLGKTFQVIAFLSGLIDADLIKCALIIMPVSLLPNWEKEFRKWSPGISVSLFHGGSKQSRERNLLKVQRRGHVLLTSYGMVLNAITSLTDFEGKPFVWDYIILDEGHKIKNPTKTTKAVHALPSRNRLVLTGTPVQNNLLELWALYDFVHQGTLLGSLKTFKMQYEIPITRAREKDSTAGEKRLGTEMAENLKMLIKPYFLRRTKAEIWSKKSESSEVVGDLQNGMEQLRISEKTLNTRKNDLIVWTFMSEAQCEIYRDFLHSDAVKMILVSKRSPLVELTTLKKVCDHPRLLSQRACLQLGLNGHINEEDLEQKLKDESSYSSSINNVTDDTLMAESGKMNFLIKLLENLKNEGHRTLVFSLSRKILDMIQRILNNRRWKVLRIDGSISKIEEREQRIQLFQNDPSYAVFLLTTQVGGVGITLTAADRVVIYDPSWNPATDAQAVDRVYRIGQQKDVIVYRLITCGTVEEKIYRRQIFKDSITKQATCSSDPYRYFSKQELRELFTFENPHHSATQVQLSQLHSHQRISDTQLDAHIAFLHSLDIFGISDHDLMFSREINDDTEDNEETAAVSHDYIKKQVANAQVMIQTEASVIAEGIRLAGTFSRPISEHNNVSKKNPKTSAQVSSSNTDSKPKGSFSSNFLGNDRKKNLSLKGSIHETEIGNYGYLDINEDVSIIELSNNGKKGNHQTSQISPNYGLVYQLSDAENKINNLPSLSSDASTPESAYVECCYTTPSKSDRELSLKESIHETEMDNFDVDINEDVSIIELTNGDKNSSHQTSQISPNYVPDCHQADAGNKTKNLSNLSFDASTPKKRDYEYQYNTPIGSDRGKNLSLKESIHETEKGNCDFDINGDVSIIELTNNDKNGSHQTSQISINYVSDCHQSDAETETNNLSNLSSDASNPEKRGAEYCNNTSTGNDREKKLSLKDSIYETEMGNCEFDLNEDNLIIELTNNSKNTSHRTSRISTNYIPDCHQSDAENETNNLSNISFDESTPEKKVYEYCNNTPTGSDIEKNLSLKNSIHETEMDNFDLDINEDTMELNHNDEKDYQNVEMKGQNQSSDQIIPFEHNSICKNERTVQEKGDAPTSIPTSHTLKESKFDSSSISSNHLDHNDSECSYQKDIEESSFHSQDLDATAEHSSVPLGDISTETVASAKSRNSLIENVSFDSFMADLSFDDKPQATKRKSCALPKPFEASDSDDSYSSEEEVLASTDSEDNVEEVSSTSSISIVPSSIPNSPAVKNPRSFLQREDSAARRRITPLKVRKSLCPPPDRAFAQALASSPVIQRFDYSSDSEVDSPVKVGRTIGRRQVIESSDED